MLPVRAFSKLLMLGVSIAAQYWHFFKSRASYISVKKSLA
jgi:hypothetical protein